MPPPRLLIPMRVPPLARFAAPSPYEVETLGRVTASGRVVWEGPVLPAAGPCVLVVWRPGARPQFVAARGALAREGRAWRFTGDEVGAGFVVLVLPVA